MYSYRGYGGWALSVGIGILLIFAVGGGDLGVWLLHTVPRTARVACIRSDCFARTPTPDADGALNCWPVPVNLARLIRITDASSEQRWTHLPLSVEAGVAPAPDEPLVLGEEGVSESALDGYTLHK